MLAHSKSTDSRSISSSSSSDKDSMNTTGSALSIEAMMQLLHQIIWGGYRQGLDALLFEPPIPTITIRTRKSTSTTISTTSITPRQQIQKKNKKKNMDIASDLKAGPTTKQTISISTTAPAVVTATNTNTDDDGAGASSSGTHMGLTPGQSEEAEDECWGIVRVIPTAEEHISCRTENCCKNTAMSWASNLNPDNHWHLCEGCQVNK